MSQIALQQMARRVAQLLEDKLQLQGDELSAKLAKGGHALPRPLREAAQTLADAAEKAENPRLMRQVDHEAAAAAYDTCLRLLRGIGPRSIWMARLGVWLRSVLTSLAIFGILLVIFLRWRGLL